MLGAPAVADPERSPHDGTEPGHLLRWDRKRVSEAAIKYGLRVDPAAPATLNPNPLGKLHNPLRPFWWALGWKKRTIRKFSTAPAEEVWIHKSVQERMQAPGEGYRPEIPSNARFVE